MASLTAHLRCPDDHVKVASGAHNGGPGGQLKADAAGRAPGETKKGEQLVDRIQDTYSAWPTRAEPVSPPSRGGKALRANARSDGGWRQEGGEPFGAGTPPHSDRNQAGYCRCTANHDPGRPG